MKPAAFHPAVSLKTVCGLVLASALALAPASALAQRGGGHAGTAAAHAGGGPARAGAVRAPAPVMHAPAPLMRAPAAGVNRPTAVIPGPILTRPGGMNPVTQFHSPSVTPRLFFPTRPPLRFPNRPIGPLVGSSTFVGFGFNPFFFPGCNPFWGVGFGCGLLSPSFGVGYAPVIVYPPYPVGPAYPDSTYPPDDSSLSLQYSPVPPVPSLPAEELSEPPGSGTRQWRSEFLLYLKDGSVFAVISYTVSDGQVHYLTTYGQKNDMAVDLLDLQKTIDANAARGVAFTLTPPAPAAGASKPSPLGPAPAPEGPITPPKQ